MTHSALKIYPSATPSAHLIVDFKSDPALRHLLLNPAPQTTPLLDGIFGGDDLISTRNKAAYLQSLQSLLEHLKSTPGFTYGIGFTHHNEKRKLFSGGISAPQTDGFSHSFFPRGSNGVEMSIYKPTPDKTKGELLSRTLITQGIYQGASFGEIRILKKKTKSLNSPTLQQLLDFCLTLDDTDTLIVEKL